MWKKNSDIKIRSPGRVTKTAMRGCRTVDRNAMNQGPSLTQTLLGFDFDPFQQHDTK